MTDEHFTFLITSGKMIIGDPLLLINQNIETQLLVKNGQWKITCETIDFDSKRVKNIIIRHISHEHCINSHKPRINSWLFGESGIVLLIDHDYYMKGDSNQINETAIMMSYDFLVCPIDNCGVVSKTGLGEGSYPIFIEKNIENEIVAIEIEFINDDIIKNYLDSVIIARNRSHSNKLSSNSSSVIEPRSNN